MFDENHSVKLDIFEGPMDLLVHLVKKNDIDVYDIPISFITERYLAYLELMKSLNIDLAGDFLLMAATLTHVKSRMLLPAPVSDEEEEDPRMEIARPLMEYLQLKSAAADLTERNLLGEDTFARKPADGELTADTDPEFSRPGLFELMDAFREVMESKYDNHSVDFSRNEMSVKDRIGEIIEAFQHKASVLLHELLDTCASRQLMVVTFLAILEMCKLGIIEIRQHRDNGFIRIFFVTIQQTVELS